MSDRLPCLILSGASGIVGRSFLQAAQDRFRIYALARRPQQKAGVPQHPNIHWLQVDIGNLEALRTVMAHIKERSNPDFVLHLAAHYDFENVELPDYAAMSYSELRWSVGVVYDLLSTAVRTGDRGLLLTYIHNLAKQRFASGFPPAEVCDALLAISNVTVEELLYKPINNGTKQEVARVS
ncbi:MAG: NAD-dependent epimerase/dehydratase family protein [Thermoanaerobaculia bacterium]